MDTLPTAPVKDSVLAVEMTPSRGEVVIGQLPTGAIAQAWLEEYSQQLTWADLTAWLGRDPTLPMQPGAEDGR